jgi:outer membrane lipoprotein carrier protein
MRTTTAILGFCGLLAATAVQAAAIDQLQAFASSTQSARGQFAQKVTDSAGKAQPPSSGVFAFQRPGKFSWVFQKPFEQTLVADGVSLYLYDKELNQVTVKKLSGAIGASPAEILFGGGDLAKSFALKESGARDGLEWLQATPRQKDAQFSRIDIGLKDGLPAAMELRDHFGQTTVLDFSKVEKNPKLPAELFKFTAPKGADVIESR